MREAPDGEILSETAEHDRLRSVYRRWAPVYDRLLGSVFRDARRRSIASLALLPAHDVVLVGVGTGLDLPLLPAVRRAVALDFTPAMLARARNAPGADARDLLLCDAQNMPLRDGSFDAAVLHLILAVAPDGALVLRETSRVVRPGGRIAVFDKFASSDRVSPVRSAMNAVTRWSGTDINRRFESMLADLPLDMVGEATAIRGAYRLITLRKRA